RISAASAIEMWSRLATHSVVKRFVVYASRRASSARDPSSSRAPAMSWGALGAMMSPTLNMGGRCGSFDGTSVVATLGSIWYLPRYWGRSAVGRDRLRIDAARSGHHATLRRRDLQPAARVAAIR